MAAGDVTRRASLTPKHRRASARRGSLLAKPAQSQSQEIPWDIIDRCALPVVLCHACAVFLSTLLNALHISDISVFTLFLWFAISVTGALWFYHNLEVQAAGKAVLVTGCDNVLGNALARRLDDLGYHVFAGFQTKTGNVDADMLKEDCSGRLHTLQLDITSETQILSASLYIVDHLPVGALGLWAIVNCESWCALGELEWVPFPVIRRSMEVNLLGPARLAQVMMPLVRRARGRIVLASSIQTHVAAPVRGVHAASLAALDALAACLRRELKPRGVEVVVVAAGEYTTGSAWLSEESMLEQARDMWRRLSDEQKGAYGEDYFETALRSLEKYTKDGVWWWQCDTTMRWGGRRRRRQNCPSSGSAPGRSFSARPTGSAQLTSRHLLESGGFGDLRPRSLPCEDPRAGAAFTNHSRSHRTDRRGGRLVRAADRIHNTHTCEIHRWFTEKKIWLFRQ